MVTPNALAGEQFYKVGKNNFITFAWNYTSLSVTPSAIDVMASCSANQATYTIAVNISAEQTKVVWDTENTPSGQAPFLTEKYTLLIMDSEADVTAAPRPGYLGVFNQFTFGIYTPQPYKDFAGKHPFPVLQCLTLTLCRFSMRKLHQERRPVQLGESDSQGPPHYLWHHSRLSPILRTQLWSVVETPRHILHTIRITMNGTPYTSNLSILHSLCH
jgi:hypothetical protein